MKEQSLRQAFDYIQKNREPFLRDFRTLLRQPSVSAQGKGIQDCARIVKKNMDAAGIRTQILPEKNGNPIVYGEVKSKSSSKTLLIYGHYDVQPVEPLEEWDSGPFDAKLQGKKIVSRGAADSKNNVTSCIKATESFLKATGDVPLNLKFLFEGEEEIGSPHLPGFIDENKERLKADSVVCYDGDFDETGRPKISLGVKGLLYVELRCKKAREDLHSSYAPLVDNPAWRLVWALNTMKGPDGKILITGWYDDVEPFNPAQSKLVGKIPFRGENYLKEWGLKKFLNAKTNREALKKYLMEPTCTICGFKTGYIGQGSKTVLPGSAIKDSLQARPSGSAEKPGVRPGLPLHQTTRLRQYLDGKRAALGLQPRPCAKRVYNNRRLHSRNTIHWRDHARIRQDKLASVVVCRTIFSLENLCRDKTHLLMPAHYKLPVGPSKNKNHE